MTATWRTVRVFISSTFKDMQAERDHLVRFVFPRLREELLRRRMHFVDVDLRWGVTSEQDAQRVCREIIDECRPRFLCMLGGRYGWTPPGRDRSITADEVRYAALDQGEPDRGHFFYFRDPVATAAMVEEHPGQYREPPGSENERRLEELKQAIRQAGYEPFVYPAEWNLEQGRLVGLEEFGRRVYDDLLASINEEFGTEAPEPVDEFAEEMARQEAFVSERTARYVVGSRQPVLDRLAEFASSDGEPSILAVMGAPGSGKSALLGKAYQDLAAAHPDWLVVPHFVGASAGSTDLRRSLRRLCHELQRATGDDEPLPDDVEELITRLPTLLEQAGTTRRVVLVIDGLNQMDPTDGAHTLRWLPHRLPQNVRIVVSSLAHPVLDALRLRREQVVEVELAPLTSADARAIAEGFAARYRKRLSEEQLEALLVKPESGSALYLLVALEELRTLGTYEEITARIEQLPGSVRDLFLWILQERLSADPGFQDAQGHLVGVELVRKCVSHLGVSRHGLSHGELVGTVDPVDPRGNVAALERLLRPYLMRRGELLDFYHGQLREAVEAEYLDEEQERLEAHRSLASYFSEQGYANLRTLAELPYHLTQASMWDGLEGTLTDLPFLEGKTTVGMVFDLAADFASAVDALPDERPQHRILRLLEQALCRDIRFIARHADDYPQALFQCLWNTCWWYDCPEAANHYIKPEGGWPPGEPPWDQPGRKLCELLQQWRTQKRTAVSRFVWIRSLRPPPIHLDTALLAILIGHKRSVVSVAFSPDGQRILSGALDGTVRVWDIRTSAELLCLRAHDEGVPACVSYSPDGAQIVIASGDGTLRVWDAETGRELDCVNAPEGHCGWVYSSLGWRSIRYVWPDPGNKVHVRDLQKGEELVTLSGHKESVTSIKYSPDNRRIVTGADETVRVWDAETGAELRCLQGHDGTVWSVEYSPDGHQIVSGGADTTVRVWDAEKGTEVRCLQGHKTGVRSVAFSPDGRRIASTSYDQTVRVWDAETGAELRCLQGHDGAVNSTAFSSDGRQIASASMDNTVRIWNVDSGARMLALCGHERAVNDVLHSPNGGRIVSASHDDTVRLWGSGSGVELNCLRGHDNWVSCLAYSPDGRRIASGAGDKTVRVWDAETGAELVCVQVRETPGSLAFSPDGRRILSRPRFGGSTRVFDAETGAELRCFEGHPHRKSLPPVEFSPDGRLIVSGSGDATVRIWEAETGAEIKCLQGHRDRVISIAFSPDGRWFASASDDNTIRLWDTQTGDEIRCLEGDRGAHTIAISPDGTRIVGALGREHTIRLWDTQTGDEIKCLQACQGQWLGGVAFLLDGERIVSHSSHYMGGDHDVTFQVWDAQTGECVDEIQRRRISLETALKSVTALGWRAFANSLETPVEPADGGDPIAWVPVAARHLTAHPSGRQWAGSYNKHLYILRLEGELPAPPAEPP